MLVHVFIAMFAVHATYCSSDQSCPDRYLQISQTHTMCSKPNPNCTILEKGIFQGEEDLILREHNKYRNKVATGKETLAGGLPPASNMLEMVWDEELAQIAQKHAETCIIGHDCTDCRAVDRFLVGQNLAYTWATSRMKGKEKDWIWYVKYLYDEVALVSKRLINSYVSNSKLGYGHFTQLIWANSWRIGCGWAYFQEGKGKTSYYVCNYGPAGNMLHGKIYKEGPPCSACPQHTCCGGDCKEFGVTPMFPGLCKVINETLHYDDFDKLFKVELLDVIFFCDFQNQSECDRTISEKGEWNVTESVGGNWISIVLKGGDNASMTMTTPFRSPTCNFCFMIDFREGTEDNSIPYGMIKDITFLAANGKSLKYHPPKYGIKEFIQRSVSVETIKNMEITVTVNFSVLDGFPPQILDIRAILVTKSKCK